jgi:hypothetical protein
MLLKGLLASGRAARMLPPSLGENEMADATPKRNDPCWCGSGKKYKNCHYAEDQEKARIGAPPGPVSEEVVEERAELTGRSLILLAVGAAAALAVGFFRDSVVDGLVVFAAAAFGVIAYAAVANPPPVKEDAGNPAALDFGMSEPKQQQREQARSDRAVNRSAKRRAGRPR